MAKLIECKEVVVRESCRAAIRTKYIPATNTKGSRVKAWKETGIEVTIPFDCRGRNEEAHYAAAKALCRKYGWEGVLLAGGFNEGGYCFVWVD